MSEFTEEHVMIRTGHAHMGLVKWAPDDTSAQVLKMNPEAKSKATIILMMATNAISHALQTTGGAEKLLALLEQKVEEASETVQAEARRIERPIPPGHVYKTHLG